MKKENSDDREDRNIDRNLSAQNRIWGAKSVGDYFEILILLPGACCANPLGSTSHR